MCAHVYVCEWQRIFANFYFFDALLRSLVGTISVVFNKLSEKPKYKLMFFLNALVLFINEKAVKILFQAIVKVGWRNVANVLGKYKNSGATLIKSFGEIAKPI